ncbi:thioesterase family protein [Flavobacterium sp. K5-23]|uniref:acyl-CoA thioesterase n=1 Tax=Flavobacterium sp. K5-23 TaxID=2746225 RepID=UPI00200E58EC|nr:acyl-CoA thioesterase [Flavobacterium sp. K5-23]UQD56766.1 thioesterase family protein [Flavobacterium sp. K5-23]
MTSFSKQLSLRWSDLDPNFHVRHSAYYDFGAQHRIEILENLGMTIKVLQINHFGPILFREECVFRKEIKLSDTIFIHTKISKMKPDASRWSIVHELKNEENQLCATITVDGAWMDTKLRKIANPTPEIAMQALSTFPRSDDFIEL